MRGFPPDMEEKLENPVYRIEQRSDDWVVVANGVEQMTCQSKRAAARVARVAEKLLRAEQANPREVSPLDPTAYPFRISQNADQRLAPKFGPERPEIRPSERRRLRDSALSL
jgi:hypothetical protein